MNAEFMKIIIDDKIPFIRGVLEPHAEVYYIPGNLIKAEDVREADALIIRTRTVVNKSLLKDSGIRFVATATIGFDHIDRDYLTQSGITWTNCPGCNSESVAQYMTAVFIELARKYSFSLRGKILGVVGAGHVGKKVIKKALALGMKVLVNDPPREDIEGKDGFTGLEELISNSDFVTFHVPLIKDGRYKTLHLADKRFLAKMKQDAFIVNTSRGEVLCNLDLKKVLQEGVIRGAVLDVWENEPEIDYELVPLVDIATSHIAGYSVDGKSNGTSMAVRALSRFFQLGLDNWYPVNTTMLNSSIKITETGLDGIIHAIRSTYDIFSDDRLLKTDPACFEYHRGRYQNRREFHNYTVSISGQEEAETLRQLGFKVKVT